MDKALLIKYRNVAKGKARIRILCDNSQIYFDGQEGTVILWNDTEGYFLVTRTNIRPNQAKLNYEVTVVEYAFVQQIIVECTKDMVEDFMEVTGHPKRTDALNLITSGFVSASNTTGSTGDNINYGNVVPQSLKNQVREPALKREYEEAAKAED